jgi:hypothetical protein
VRFQVRVDLYQEDEQQGDTLDQCVLYVYEALYLLPVDGVWVVHAAAYVIMRTLSAVC